MTILPPCPLYRLPQEGVAQIEERPAHLERSELKISLRTSNDLLKKYFTGVLRHLGFC